VQHILSHAHIEDPVSLESSVIHASVLLLLLLLLQ
jgi:hypothetical protein